MIEEMLIYPFKNLFRKKGRTLITVFGVAVGVCSVIIINSIGIFGTTSVNTELESLGLSGLTVSAKNSGISLTDDELDIIRYTQGVKSATPVFVENSEVMSSFGKSENSVIWGIDSNAKDIVSLQLMYGREITRCDISENSAVCMVDKTFAQKMFGKDNAVGHNITLNLQGNTQIFTIAGVIKTGSGLLQSAMGNYIPNFIYIPYTTMQYLTGATNYNQIIIKINSQTNPDVLTKNIEQRLSISGNQGKDNYVVTNLAQQKESLNKILGIVTSVLSAVGAISLFVAGLSIMIVMIVSVSERKREIGIKKAIGAKKSAIVREFLGEALILSLTGCIVGVLISFLIVWICSSILNTDFSINFKTAGFTCIFSMISGVIFGVYPALKASNLNPCETLRAL